MNNLESMVNKLLPMATKGAILIGILVCLGSVTIAIYSYIKKKQSAEKTKTYLF